VKVDPPPASPLELTPPELPLQPPPGPVALLLVRLINENPLKVWCFLILLAAGAVAGFCSLFGWLLLSEAGSYLLLGLVGVFALLRLADVTLVAAGLFALASVPAALAWAGQLPPDVLQYWPLALALAVPLPLAVLIDRLFFRKRTIPPPRAGRGGGRRRPFRTAGRGSCLRASRGRAHRPRG